MKSSIVYVKAIYIEINPRKTSHIECARCIICIFEFLKLDTSMKKALLLLIFGLISVLLLAQQPTYSRVKIFLDTKTAASLFSTGIEVSEAGSDNTWYIAEIAQDEIATVEKAGFRYEILIKDMDRYYKDRFQEKKSVSKLDLQLNEDWPKPANFSLGSCGGFSTIAEMTAQLELMRTLYPSLISVKIPVSDTIKTIEGRTVYYVRISDNPDVNESEPEVLYTAMHHAREPIGMQHLLYYMWYLLENYNTNPTIKSLVDNTEMYFIPVVNIDGYQYNITNKPTGGGMWRKNRRSNSDGSFGVDINRNYGAHWGFDDNGSSPNPGDETYRGKSSFSEPETRMMKYFCESHEFRIALNYHSYANLLLYPWGWISNPPADVAVFDTYAQVMTKENHYNFGSGYTTIYPTNGGSDDWMYGEQKTKPKILAYTPEIGKTADGFWPSQQRILPLIQENMLTSISTAYFASNYFTVTDNSSLFIKPSGYLPFEIKRIGLKDEKITVSIRSLNQDITSLGAAKSMEGMSLLETRKDSISYQLSNTLRIGDTILYVITASNPYFTEHDTVVRIIGNPVTLFTDDFTQKNNWNGTWDISTTQFVSPPSCLTDSPVGNYLSAADKTTVLNKEIDLKGSMLAVLQFKAKWELEKDYDYVQVSITDDNGLTWTAIGGEYSSIGSADQKLGQPVYDSKISNWVREDISLKKYIGKKISIQFRIKADRAIEMDGFYIDDLSISILADTKTAINNKTNTEILGFPYPNPTSKNFSIIYSFPGGISENASLTITTLSGIEVSSTRITHKQGLATINTEALSKGVYLVKIKSEKYQSGVRKLVVN